MSNYIGVKCPVCNKKFAQADDVVVCPVCGAPHHRGCYTEKGECAFAADHLTGREWRAPAPESPPREAETAGAGADTAECPMCKSPNPKGAFFCQICGRPLPQQGGETRQAPYQGAGQWGFPGLGGFGGGSDPSVFIYGGLSPDDTIDDVPARDLALYIGDNSAYYLANFKRMDATSRTLSFNVSSLLFGFFYFFYRKMYVVGSALLALSIAGAVPLVLQLLYYYNLGPGAPVDQAIIDHYQWLLNITNSINLAIGMVISLCANKFYYMKAIRDVKKIRANRADPPDERAYAETLSNRGGVNRVAITVVICMISAVYFAYFICIKFLLT